MEESQQDKHSVTSNEEIHDRNYADSWENETRMHLLEITIQKIGGKCPSHVIRIQGRNQGG